MPNDDWAKAASKERGRKARASGEYFSCKTEKTRKQKNNARKHLRTAVTKQIKRRCECGSKSESRQLQTFKDSTVHIRVSCSDCGNFKRWAKQ